MVDDGVATGLTILLAIMVLKGQHPKKIVVAVPVSSPEAAERIRAEADELVALDVPDNFSSVSEHYEEFGQLEDEDVIRLIRKACREGIEPLDVLFLENRTLFLHVSHAFALINRHTR